MKNLSYQIVLISSLLFATSCGSNQYVSNDSTSTEKCNDSRSAVIWQQNSAEYAALCLQAYNAAKNALTSPNYDGSMVSDKAIIMDLDETVLDNSPYNGFLIKNNLEYSNKTWSEWVNLERAKAVPGAVDFINYAQQLGYEIYFISNRNEELQESTLNNLRNLEINVSEDNLYLKTLTSNKSERRQLVRDNYEVAMLIGDNIKDLNDEFDQENVSSKELKSYVEETFSEYFGTKFIILPNPMYGSWQNSKRVLDFRNDADSDY